jgi:hypothetical protein
MWNKINKIYNVTSPRENTIQEKPKAPRMHQTKHQEILQSFTLLLQERLPNGTKNHKRKMGENEREWGEILA